MGTQQILLIVLSVIIVGAAVAVGIDMFNRQDFTSNRSSAASDVQIFLTQVLQYYKMPESLGGLGNDLDNLDDAEQLAKYIGWGDDHPMKNDNAHYLVELPNNDEQVVYIKAIGRSSLAGKRPVVHGRIRFPDGEIRSRVGEIELTTDVTETDFNFDLWETE
nr:hypothetical protein [Candidatus Cloacimonadota bacterium]